MKSPIEIRISQKEIHSSNTEVELHRDGEGRWKLSGYRPHSSYNVPDVTHMIRMAAAVEAVLNEQ